ncbi:MAG: hypothetical protein LBN11_01525 [Tannerella sp.]|jgi:hypothetical protein|nr:hypothetical protein [Tannerella sp.]
MKAQLLFLSVLFSLSLSAQIRPDSVAVQPDSILTGTHHSLSYVRPAWYWRPVSWMAQYQDLTLREQIEYGVSYFDIRLRFKKNKVISGHGFIDYNIDVLDVLQTLDSITSRPIYVRILYESRPLSKNPPMEQLAAFIDSLEAAYPRLIFLYSYLKSPYTRIKSGAAVPVQILHPYYKNYGAKSGWQKLKGLRLPLPKRAARRNNREYWMAVDSAKINVFDFVEIK